VDPGLVILLVYGAIAALASTGSLLGLRRRRRRTIAASHAVAETAELTEVEVSRVSPVNPSIRLRARSGPLGVEMLTSFFSGPKGQRSVIAIAGLADLSLTAEGLRSSVSRIIEGLELHVGDPSFDDTLFVRGPEPLVRAVLDAETRRLVLLLFQGRVEVLDEDTTRALESVVSVHGGTLTVQAVNVISSPKWLGECLLALLDVARRLAQPADIGGRLAANVHHDPLPAVRLANLRVLLAECPGRPATVQALRSSLEDPDPGVRVWAATELGEEGHAVLRAVASDFEGPEPIQARALWTLGPDVPLEDATGILSRALRSRRLAVVEACLDALGRRGGSDVVAPLAKVLAVERGPLAAAAARALGESGEATAEGPLGSAIGRDDEGVAVASVEALGHVGGLAIIPRLKAAESASGEGALRGAAREAVALIQARTGATPGQLSLAGDVGGQLSLTADETGRVTLPDEGPATD
jgi:hypothetical protein